MKKLLLLLTFVITSLYASAAAPIYVEIDSITYIVRQSDAGVYKAEDSITQANIASNVTYNGVEYPVTSIEDEAFRLSKLTSVTIPTSIVSIGDKAFNSYTSLTRVDISDLEAWCRISFYGSYSNPLAFAKHLYLNGEEITNMIIPNSVTSIGNYAFNGWSGLTSVTIPNSVTSIGNYAFNGCSGLTSVTIPNSVINIGGGAFRYCSGLTSVTISNSVTSIGNFAFEHCSGLTSVTIPNSVINIGACAFSRCSGLTSVTIPSSVTSIGNYAFEHCSGLTSITIPSSVTSIGKDAFYECSGLTRVDISDLEAWCKISFIGSTHSNPLWPGDADLYLNGEKVVDLTIPNTIEDLPFATFVHCSSIETVRFSEGCKTLTDDGWNFQGCKNLKEVYLSSTITDIGGYYTFAYCPAMETVYCYAITPPECKYNYAFEESYPEYMTLHVPQGTKDAYASSSPWNQFGIIIDDLEQASVEDVIANDINDGICVYNLQGIRMDVSNADELNSLPAGLYIVNGKKLIVNGKKL